nr:hypothetical protein [Tanacetum cinerariifolium]
MGKVSKGEKKIAYNAKLCQLLDDYTQVLVVAADNVGSNQLQNIRIHSEKTGVQAYLNLIPLLVVLVVAADNVGSNLLQNIRQGLRPESIILMGKNTMIKRSIRIHSEKTGVHAYLNRIPLRVIVASIEQYLDLDEMSVDKAIGRLNTFEERLKSKKKIPVNSQESLMFTRHEGQRKPFREYGHGRFNQSRGR